MSPTGFKPNLTGPLKCFNGASNRQLGWFDDRTQTVKFKNKAGEQLVTVAAFSENDKTQDSDPVLVTVGPYSLQYNYASEFNVGTEILRNQVTVSYAVPGGTMVHKEGLQPDGVVFVVDNFEDSGSILRIEACEKISGGRFSPNAMSVLITLGGVGSQCDKWRHTLPPKILQLYFQRLLQSTKTFRNAR